MRGNARQNARVYVPRWGRRRAAVARAPWTDYSIHWNSRSHIVLHVVSGVLHDCGGGSRLTTPQHAPHRHAPPAVLHKLCLPEVMLEEKLLEKLSYFK